MTMNLTPTFKNPTFRERIGGMLGVDFYRLFHTPLFYINSQKEAWAAPAKTTRPILFPISSFGAPALSMARSSSASLPGRDLQQAGIHVSSPAGLFAW